MSKLLGEDALARMAAILLARAQTRLVIRAGTDFVSGEFSHIGLRRRISIYLLSFCKTEGQEGFFEVRYTSDDDPAGWHTAKFDLRPLGTLVGPFSPELYLEPLPDLMAVQDLLAIWERIFPPFVTDAEVAVYTKDRNGTYATYGRTAGSGVRLVMHYARLYGWLEQLTKSEEVPGVWATETFLKRLGALLGDRFRNSEFLG